ncbi:MAG: thiamine-monophosphate kinase [Sphingomonadales bacterium]|nr:thiamine-monophosphate kinase [Sphingomonadales bacterium]
MSAEAAFIDSLRSLATSAAARGLADDAAVLEVGGTTLVLTHDAIAEGVHFLPDDPPGDVAWKLVAVNLSDLAAKGARPLGVLLGFALGDEAWDRAFVEGLGIALRAFGLPLLGGDTVVAPRVLGLTAIGEATGPVPSRSGAKPGDLLWVSGTIGDSGAGLRGLRGTLPHDAALVERYRNPRPRLEGGQRLAPLVTAMMDVSDGLLIDASRMAAASAAGLEIDLSLVPLSEAYRVTVGDDREARLAAATAGDDYELLFTAAPERGAEVLSIADRIGLPLNRIGRVAEGSGLSVTHAGEAITLPPRLGWQHG